jgi:hypothetical protein
MMNLCVADTGNDAIRKITPTGVVTTLVGQLGQLGHSGFTAGSLPGALAKIPAWNSRL